MEVADIERVRLRVDLRVGSTPKSNCDGQAFSVVKNFRLSLLRTATRKCETARWESQPKRI